MNVRRRFGDCSLLPVPLTVLLHSYIHSLPFFFNPLDEPKANLAVSAGESKVLFGL